MKVRFKVSYGFVGAQRQVEMELDDDMTDEGIDEICKEWAWERVDCNWERVE